MLAWYTYDLSTLLLLIILVAACWSDMLHHRISNRLVLVGIVAGVTLHWWFLGGGGALKSLAGLLVGGLMLLPFYLVKVNNQRMMSAGDVKLMAAVGTFLGPLHIVLATGLTLGAGSVAGLGYLLWKKGFSAYLQRYVLVLKTLVMTGQWVYQSPDSDGVAMHRFPYALAIATGTLLTLGYQSLLQFYYLRSWISGVGL